MKIDLLMDVRDYCKGMETEMTAWKAKLYDVVRKVDKIGSGDKEKVLPNIEDLHTKIPYSERFSLRIS